MNNTLKYILVGALVFALVFFVALPFFGANAGPWGIGCGWNRGGWGFPGGMMNGFGLFGWWIMFGMLLYPILIIGLIVAGLVWLVKATNRSNQHL